MEMIFELDLLARALLLSSFGLRASRSSLGSAALRSPAPGVSASPFASSASRSAKLENISTDRRPYSCPRPPGVAQALGAIPRGCSGRGGRPSPPGGLGRPRRQTPRTTRQLPLTTESRGRPARTHGALTVHTTARYLARKLGVRLRRATGALPGARTRTLARLNRHVSAACNRHVSAACNRRRLAHNDACKSTQLASYLDRSAVSFRFWFLGPFAFPG